MAAAEMAKAAVRQSYAPDAKPIVSINSKRARKRKKSPSGCEAEGAHVT